MISGLNQHDCDLRHAALIRSWIIALLESRQIQTIPCPSISVICAFLLGEITLEGDHWHNIAAHVLGCRSCGEQLETLITDDEVVAETIEAAEADAIEQIAARCADLYLRGSTTRPSQAEMAAQHIGHGRIPESWTRTMERKLAGFPIPPHLSSFRKPDERPSATGNRDRPHLPTSHGPRSRSGAPRSPEGDTGSRGQTRSQRIEKEKQRRRRRSSTRSVHA